VSNGLVPESLKRVLGLVGLAKFLLDLDAGLLDQVQSLREMNQVECGILNPPTMLEREL
jgi:hypothetical protein